MKTSFAQFVGGSLPPVIVSLLFLVGGALHLGGVWPASLDGAITPAVALLFCLLCLRHVALSLRQGWRTRFRANSLSAILMAATVGALLFSLPFGATAPFTPAWLLGHAMLLLSLLELGSLNRLLVRRSTPAALFVVLGFLIVILVGAALLMLPAATHGDPVGFVDALFTSVSATCVTGLTVVDTGSVFTPFGLGVLFLLFQIGGLGILTVTSFFALLLSRDLGTRERLAITENFGTSGFRGLRGLRGLILRLIAFTLTVEAIGALLLHLTAGPGLGSGHARVGSAVFHAVSAFCNAGFSLQADSLAGFTERPGALLTVMALVMIGGLGFLLCFELLSRAPLPRRNGRPRRRLSLQGRLVLVGSVLLWVVGALIFLVAERHGVLADRGEGEKLLLSLFQSVTCRTAGFEVFPQSALSPGGGCASILLMFIGAAPGSTGGGVKVSTVALTLLLLVSYFKGRDRVDVAGRTVPETVVREALAVLGAALFVVSAAVLALLLVEKTALAPTLFEAVSAFATVGLSTGLSAELGGFGKLLIVLLMFCGRVGLLTVALGVSGGLRRRRYDLPSEGIMIG